MILDHNKKIGMIERVWNLDTKVKQIRLQIEVRGITAEKDILQKIEQEIKDLQLCLQESLPKKPVGYIWEHISNNPFYTSILIICSAHSFNSLASL